MNDSSSRVLITGAAGFLGQALVSEFLRAGVAVRGFDICPPKSMPHPALESVTGDVADPAAVDAAVAGCHALVIAHMAPNRPEVYASPVLPFDINVKGTALLLDAAVRHGARRVVLISSVAVVENHRAGERRLTLDLPPSPGGTYGLTKALQEQVASYYHEHSKLDVVILRPCYVTDADTLADKYGTRRPSVNWQFIDRRDVAGAALAALRATGLRFGRYFIHGHPKGADRLETGPTERDLGWKPRHDFSAYPDDPAQ